jgi:hypothetical protein
VNSGSTKGGFGCLKLDEYSATDDGNAAHFGILAAIAGAAIAVAMKIREKYIFKK